MNEFECSDANCQELISEGAKRYDKGKLRWDLIPFDALEKVVEVYTHGASKYEDENWRKGMKYKRMYGPMFRHLTKSFRGQDLDPDSGCFHLAQVAWGCLSMLWFQMNGVGEDNREIDLDDPNYMYEGNLESMVKQHDMFWSIIAYWEKKKEEKTFIENKIVDEIKKKRKFPKSRNPKEGEQYRHFKGNLYEIVCVSFNTEGDNEALVTYKEVNGNQIWTRPLSMFNEYVPHPKDPESKIKRFIRIEEQSEWGKEC